jgi:hypothetical protein
MSHTLLNRRQPRMIATGVLLLLAALGVTACGSSSSGSSSARTAASSGVRTPTGSAGRLNGELGKRNAAIRGQRSPQGAPGPGTAGVQPPRGVTRAQYEAALKKCGAGRLTGAGARFKSPAFKAALAKFATCLRQSGVNVPAPNTSGQGPVFDTRGIDTKSARFRAAEAKCQSDLVGAFRRGGPAGAPGGGVSPGAAPPRSGEAPGGAAGAPPTG